MDNKIERGLAWAMKFIHRAFYVIVKLIGMSKFTTVWLEALKVEFQNAHWFGAF